jgi:uncharacterized phosphatase
MKTIICLVRHGETVWNKTFRIQGRINNLLSDEGIQQAHDTATYLLEHDPKWDVIVTSPLTRAYDTATIIATNLHYTNQIEVVQGLTERDFGKAEGLQLSKEVYEKMYAGDFEGIEQEQILQKRCMDTVLDLASRYPNQKILATTHSHFIKGLFTQIDPNIFFTTSLKNGSLNYIEVENNIVRSVAFNVSSHL